MTAYTCRYTTTTQFNIPVVNYGVSNTTSAVLRCLKFQASPAVLQQPPIQNVSVSNTDRIISCMYQLCCPFKTCPFTYLISPLFIYNNSFIAYHDNIHLCMLHEPRQLNQYRTGSDTQKKSVILLLSYILAENETRISLLPTQ